MLFVSSSSSEAATPRPRNMPPQTSASEETVMLSVAAADNNGAPLSAFPACLIEGKGFQDARIRQRARFHLMRVWNLHRARPQHHNGVSFAPFRRRVIRISRLQIRQSPLRRQTAATAPEKQARGAAKESAGPNPFQ